MAARARPIEQEETVSINIADLVRRVEADPSIVLTDEETFEAYYGHVESQALTVEVDLSTTAGRDRIKSAAYEIARKKTAIDNAGKALTEDWRRKTATVNAVRKVASERFSALQDRVRHPLTVWEDKEKARREEADAILADLRNGAIVRAEETAEDVRKRLDRIRGINLNDELFGPRIEMAVDLRDEAVAALSEALARLVQQEKERAELERLRRAEAERQEREAREKQEREAREAEEARQRDEAARIECERQEAADKARQAAEEAAQAEQRAVEAKRNYARDIIQHIKDVGMGMIGGQTYPYPMLIRELEEKIVIDDAMGDMQEEVRAIRDATLASVRSAMELAAARAAKEAQDEEDRRVAAERARREADQQHRSAVRTAAKEAIMTCGVDEDTARKIVLAIQAGEVPAVRIEF